jgi:hypothetical protein
MVAISTTISPAKGDKNETERLTKQGGTSPTDVSPEELKTKSE